MRTERCPFGLEAEKWAMELLRAGGYRVQKGSHFDDHVVKVDFWVWSPKRSRWMPIQFTVDRKAAVSGKGIDCVKHGVIISCLPADKLEEWAVQRNALLGRELTSEFWRQINLVLQSFGANLEKVWRQNWWRSVEPADPRS